jgi:hypothetical protein
MASDNIWIDVMNLDQNEEMKGKWEVVGPWRRLKQ